MEHAPGRPQPPSGKPDPRRAGGIDWAHRTHGALTKPERRRMLGAILRGQAQAAAGRIGLILGRRPNHTIIPAPPDSALARQAEEEASAQQSAALLGHAHRTWAFGRALAHADRVADFDEEAFYVACLLHDVGLMEAVPGQDFTIRSAAAARAVAAAHLDDQRVRLAEDAIVAHCTPGATVDLDGPHGFYCQSGAICDLAGVRLNHLSADYVSYVLAQHPRQGLAADIIPRIAAEARAVPEGRFALLHRCGFGPIIRISPLPG